MIVLDGLIVNGKSLIPSSKCKALVALPRVCDAVLAGAEPLLCVTVEEVTWSISRARVGFGLQRKRSNQLQLFGQV